MIEPETMQQVIGFHGHMCPGLAMGMRAAEVALTEIGPHSSDEEVVAVVETDMCGVDAIQFLTGCTFGKGNLVHRDHGKNAYTFIRRRDGKAVRISSKPGSWGVRDPAWYDLFAAVRAGVASPEDRRRFGEIQQERSQAVLEAPLGELYDVREVEVAAPRPARILASVDCADCNEPTMETRIRRFEGAELCRPCFESRLAGNVPLASPQRRTAD